MNVFELVASLKLDKSKYEEGLKEAGSDGVSFGNGLSSKFKGIAQTMGGSVNEAFGNINNKLKSASDGFKGFANTVQSSVSSKFKPIGDAFSAVGERINGVKENFKGFANSVGSSIKEKIKPLGDAFSAIGEKFAPLGEKFGALGKSIGSVVSGIGPALAGVGTVAVGALGAAAAGVGVLAKSAVESYAAYEQLSGGVQKLYGEATNQVMQYAQNAWMTAGISANEYMEQTTSFTASLINSLGGDTAKAAEMADVAMRAMSDNVNTFGSDMQSVQNAFQGFSRGNYTMLDNLKLGFAGTKEGMQELIDSANAYRASIGETSDLSIDSFADIVQAIQSVQEQQGIAGTTAKEAMRTIEGSANATKAAWKNVLTAIAGGGDLKNAMGNLATAIFGDGSEGTGLLANVIPRIQAALEGIGEFLTQAVPLLGDKIPDLINALVPPLISSAVSLVGALVSALPSLIQGLWDSVVTLVMQGVESLRGMMTGIPSDLVGALLEGTESFLTVGTEFINFLVDGILESLPMLIDGAYQAITTFADYLIRSLPLVLQAGADIIMNLVNGIISNLPAIVNSAITGLMQFVATIGANLPLVLQKGIEIIGNLVAGVISAVPQLIGAIPSIVSQAANAFLSFDWLGVGINIISGIVSGIWNAAGSVVNALMSVAKSAFDSVLGFFGIKSPSRLFRDMVGKNLMLGMAEGVEVNDPTREIVGTVSGVMDKVEQAMKMPALSLPVDIEQVKEALKMPALTASVEPVIDESFVIPVQETRRDERDPAGFEEAMERQVQRILDVFAIYFPQFSKTRVVLDSGTLVGEMLPEIDGGLGFAL